MCFSDAPIPLQKLIILFSVLLIIGIGLCIPLFNFKYRKFVRSDLFIKILFWIPIFIIFLGVLYVGNIVRLSLLIILLGVASWELVRVLRKRKNKVPFVLFFIFFAVGLMHFYLLGTMYQRVFIDLLITLCFSTVMSDVAAFFFGNYLGRHKLPDQLNNHKSWEGVFGQVLGALAGVLLVNAFVIPVISIWLFLPLGIGSAIGDLANSYIKRQALIKDWGKSIPGHGGFIDRLSSFAGSTLLTFYFLQITGLA